MAQRATTPETDEQHQLEQRLTEVAAAIAVIDEHRAPYVDERNHIIAVLGDYPFRLPQRRIAALAQVSFQLVSQILRALGIRSPMGPRF